MTGRVHDCGMGIHPAPAYACYRICGCRCYGCAAIRSDYDRRRAREIAKGRWQPFVDAGPVREHVRSLMASGLGRRQVAKASGVSDGSIVRLLYGHRSQGRPPSRKVRRETAERLYAVHPGLIADGQYVDARATWRRIDEMLAAGVPKVAIARAVVGPQARALQLGRVQVTAGNARKVHALFARWKHNRRVSA